MELSGKVYKVNPVESGEGKNGTWKKQQVVLEIDNGKYPKKVAVVFWGDLVNDRLQEGEQLSVEFDIESREFNGKWYTDVKAWRINNNSSSNNNSARTTPVNNNTPPAYTMTAVPDEDQDLPF